MDTHSKGGKQMIRTVEKGKTLLIDGPASAMVTSGKVEVFGSLVGGTSKVVVREGKRLPFAVEEKATFDISLGEDANVEEVDGNTIPSSWVKSFEELVKIQSKPAIAMVLGAVDSGKTSFCTYLINRLLREKKKVVIIDGDLGQSDIGPPCTVAYTFATKPITDLFNLEAKNASFIGVTSPNTATEKVIDGLISIKREILSSNPDFVVINTDGWVEEDEAVNYKIQLVKNLNPDVVFCIQQKDEMSPFLKTLEKFTTFVVDSPPAIKQRSIGKRRTLRELGYIKYLRNAKVQSLPLSWLKIEEDETFGLSKAYENTRQARRIYELLGMKPLHLAELKDRISIVIGRRRWIDEDNVKKAEEVVKKKIVVTRKGEEEGLLMGAYNGERRFLGIGILQEVDYARKTLKIFTPAAKEISIVALGKVRLDKNLKEVPVFTEENQPEFSEMRRLF
jgi:polynucleotide 5'-hydroxyl-kinase GRC3/NOL9